MDKLSRGPNAKGVSSYSSYDSGGGGGRGCSRSEDYCASTALRRVLRLFVSA